MNTKSFIIWTTVLLGCFLFAIFAWVLPAPTPPNIPVKPEPRPISEINSREAFYQEAVDPRIKSTTQGNEEAAQRCIEKIEERIEGYRRGIDPFVAEINSWGSRLRVIKRMGTDWWYKENDVAEFVGKKVGKHLFDDKKLRADISSSLNQFRNEVQANENTMLIQIRAAVKAGDGISIPEEDIDAFAQLFDRELNQYANTLAVDSLKRAVLTEVISGIGGAVATHVVRQVAIRMATTIASTATSAGGATAATTVAGGASGTAVGPWGTAAGVVGGLIVGLAIDWWMSESYEAELSRQLNEMLDQVKLGAIQGVEGTHGLKATLEDTCVRMQRAYEKTLYEQIVAGAAQ